MDVNDEPEKTLGGWGFGMYWLVYDDDVDMKYLTYLEIENESMRNEQLKKLMDMDENGKPKRSDIVRIATPFLKKAEHATSKYGLI